MKSIFFRRFFARDIQKKVFWAWRHTGTNKSGASKTCRKVDPLGWLSRNTIISKLIFPIKIYRIPPPLPAPLIIARLTQTTDRQYPNICQGMFMWVRSHFLFLSPGRNRLYVHYHELSELFKMTDSFETLPEILRGVHLTDLQCSGVDQVNVIWEEKVRIGVTYCCWYDKTIFGKS